MDKQLNGRRIAILVPSPWDKEELVESRKMLEDAGAQTFIIWPAADSGEGWVTSDGGDEVPLDIPLEISSADDFDALLLPSAITRSDKLRGNARAIHFVEAFFDAGKPVDVITSLVKPESAGALDRRRRITSPAIIESTTSIVPSKPGSGRARKQARDS